MRIGLHQTEDGRIHLVTEGECHGELHFHGYGSLVTLVGKLDELVRDCDDFIEACLDAEKGATPIPQAFLDAFAERGDS
jgi:hypothetical protein